MMSQDRAIQLRDMAFAIIQPKGVPPPVGQGEVKGFVGERLTITLKAPVEKINTLTIWNGMDQVLCVGWSDENTRVFCYEAGEWERELEDTPAGALEPASTVVAPPPGLKGWQALVRR
jgi:hypothetical protein